MFCYEVTVPTTNSAGNAFRVGDTYHPCISGVVYVVAESVFEIGGMIPTATVVRCIGRAFTSGMRNHD